MTQFPDFWTQLFAKFDKQDVKNRKGPGGVSLLYVTARTVMNRLDDVVGPENWYDTYHHVPGGILCELTIRLPDGKLITKADGAAFGDKNEEEDVHKTCYSEAFKRAAAKLGVGRYLYRDRVPDFVRQFLGDAQNNRSE